MARARQKPSGVWEIGLRHPKLPGGRRYFTFPTESEANSYAEQWRLMKLAGVDPPAELLQPASMPSMLLGPIIRAWASSGKAAPSQQSALGSLFTEVGSTRLVDADYAWLSAYVQRLKTVNNLAPNSIRHRIQALGRAIDEYLRLNPKVSFVNPVKLLPRGYSTYTEVDAKLAKAAGKEARHDVERDRRLHDGEEARIVAALSGVQRKDKPRGMPVYDGALLTMFLLIVNSGLRLREAYLLRRGWVDLEARVMRVQCSKQWRGRVVFREVPIVPAAHAALTRYLATRPAMLPAAYLFPFMEEEADITLKKVTQRLSDRYRHAFEYAGCADLHEHDLRHEATCRWLELRGRDGNWLFRLEEVNRIMGWSNNSTMAQRYASFRGADFAARVWAATAAAPAGEAESAGGK